MPNIQHLDFITYLLDEKILDLLTAINIIEPSLFKKENIEEEKKIILENIEKSNLDTKQFEELLVKQNITKESKSKNTKTRKKTQYDNNCRCHARTWGPIYIDGKQKKYGHQCYKKKGNNSNYCFIHQTKLSHGDYFKEPNIMIREHFETNSTVIKQNQIKIKKIDENSNKSKNYKSNKIIGKK